jgi:hypothetical protein
MAHRELTESFPLRLISKRPFPVRALIGLVACVPDCLRIGFGVDVSAVFLASRFASALSLLS